MVFLGHGFYLLIDILFCYITEAIIIRHLLEAEYESISYLPVLEVHNYVPDEAYAKLESHNFWGPWYGLHSYSHAYLI